MEIVSLSPVLLTQMLAAAAGGLNLIVNVFATALLIIVAIFLYYDRKERREDRRVITAMKTEYEYQHELGTYIGTLYGMWGLLVGPTLPNDVQERVVDAGQEAWRYIFAVTQPRRMEGDGDEGYASQALLDSKHKEERKEGGRHDEREKHH